MKKLLLFSTIFLISGLAFTGCLRQQLSKLPAKTEQNDETIETVNQVKETPTTEEQETTMVGNDEDEHGCKGSAGYQWCEQKQKCIRPWEETCETKQDDEENIQQALRNKHEWSEDEMKITVSEIRGNYASGGAVPNSDIPAGGGFFFAAKVDEQWKIVADGNGAIMCSSLKDYPDFPNDMIPECYNEDTGKVVKR